MSGFKKYYPSEMQKKICGGFFPWFQVGGCVSTFLAPQVTPPVGHCYNPKQGIVLFLQCNMPTGRSFVISVRRDFWPNLGVWRTFCCNCLVAFEPRWRCYLTSNKVGPTSYKWSYNPYKWPYKSVTGVITRTFLVPELFVLLGTGQNTYSTFDGVK